MNTLLPVLETAAAVLAAAVVLARRRARRRRAVTQDNLERWLTRRSLHPWRDNRPFEAGGPLRGPRR